MTIEQKLAYLQKAIEMGAYIDVSFHDVEEKEEAEKIAAELSLITNNPFVLKTNTIGDTAWYKMQDWDNKIETAVFFNPCMKEDVDLSGGVESA